MSECYRSIFKRKSFHLFDPDNQQVISAAEFEQMKAFLQQLDSLDPAIRVIYRLVDDSAQSNCPRHQQCCLLIYSQIKDGYLANAGYLGEQIDLYLVSHDIGTLWYGMHQPVCRQIEDCQFVIMIAMAKISNPALFRKDMLAAKRKPVEEIWQGPVVPGVSELVRFAPSACNTQPWRVVSENGTLKVYRYRQAGRRGLMPAAKVAYYNQIDIGIFLFFLQVLLDEQGYKYERRLYPESGLNDDELTLNAEYQLS